MVETRSLRTAQTEMVSISSCNPFFNPFVQKLCAFLERKNEMLTSNNTQGRIQHHIHLRLALVVLVIATALLLIVSANASLRTQLGSGLLSSAQNQENPQSLNRWSSNGPDGGEVLSLAIDPSNPATIYAGTAVGLFKSTNGGATWSISLAGGYIKDLVVYAPNPNIIYAGSSKSTDGGLSWQPMNLGGHPFAV